MLEKCMTILECITSDSQCNSLSDIAKKTKIPKTTVYRLLNMMVDCNMLIERVSGGYVVSDRLVSICLKGDKDTNFLSVLIPIADSLRNETHETVSINVVSGAERMCIYRAQGDQIITRMVQIGSHAPLFFGASGRVLAAALDEKAFNLAINFALSVGDFDEREKDSVIEKINKDKRRGYVLSIEERHKGCASLALPVKRQITGETVAALSISATAERMKDPQIFDRYFKLIKRAVAEANAKIVM